MGHASRHATRSGPSHGRGQPSPVLVVVVKRWMASRRSAPAEAHTHARARAHTHTHTRTHAHTHAHTHTHTHTHTYICTYVHIYHRLPALGKPVPRETISGTPTVYRVCAHATLRSRSASLGADVGKSRCRCGPAQVAMNTLERTGRHGTLPTQGRTRCATVLSYSVVPVRASARTRRGDTTRKKPECFDDLRQRLPPGLSG